MMSNVIECLQEEKNTTGFNHSLIFDSGSPPAFRCFFFTAGMDGGWMFDLPKMLCLHWGGETAMTAAQRELWEAQQGGARWVAKFNVLGFSWFVVFWSQIDVGVVF